MPTAPVNGIDLYYEEHGRGFPVVFAHGAGGNHLSWWQQIPVFSQNYRCITFDHRGWGLSVDATGQGPAAFVEDLRSLLDYLGVERAFLVGQSMGGLTCLGLALAQPARVRALVMANTFAGMRRSVWLAADDELRARMHELWERRRNNGVKRALGREFVRQKPQLAFLYSQIRALNQAGPNRLDSGAQIQRLRALERSPGTAATPEALAGLPIPVLFIGGQEDEVMPVPLMEIAHRLIPRSEMAVIPGAGHSVYFEQPETFNRLVLEFFDRVP